MLLRNKDFRQGIFLFLPCLLLLGILGMQHSFMGCVLCLLAGLLMLAAHCLVELRRYRKLQKLAQDLDALLLQGTPLFMADYEEGELSVLASQMQKLTSRLTEAKDALQKDKEFLADSLADISHQLRTPLTAMHLTLSLLQDPQLEPKKRLELMRDFRALLSRTEWLVETLLKLSKLDAGRVHFVKEPVSLQVLLEHAAAPLAIAMELRQQSLSLPQTDCILLCDLTWTAEALGNVLKNAMEHSPTGGRISIHTQDTPLFTKIEIEDEGGGFAKEDLPHLFERFYRGKNADAKSCGIGLALSRSIIAAQNGSIQAANTEKGAKFMIKLYKQVI